MQGDGDGWIDCARGHRHWGRYGAAGLLIRTADSVVLQHRAVWSHHGGTWGIPGGARDSHESVAAAALREAAEEARIDPQSVRITAVHCDDHDGWSYTTVLAEPVAAVEPRSADSESIEVAWQLLDAVDLLPLHPGLALSWPALRAAYPPPRLVVDAANVVGSKPDGWWHERSAAAQRLFDQLAVFARSGLRPWSGPLSEGAVGLSPRLAGPCWPQQDRFLELSWLYPHVTMVVEGEAARLDVADSPSVRVVRASGSGDDAIVSAVAEQPQAVVVTADRELRSRVTALGAQVVGPRWLYEHVER